MWIISADGVTPDQVIHKKRRIWLQRNEDGALQELGPEFFSESWTDAERIDQFNCYPASSDEYDHATHRQTGASWARVGDAFHRTVITEVSPALRDALKARVTQVQVARAGEQVVQFDLNGETHTMDITPETKERLAALFGIALFGLIPPSGSYSTNEGSVTLTSGELMVIAGAIVVYHAMISGISAAKRSQIDGLDLADLPEYDVNSGWPSQITVVDLDTAIDPPTTGVLTRLAVIENWKAEASLSIADHGERLTALEGA